MDTLYRSFTPQIELRSSGEGRTLHGIAVPYGQAQRIDERLVEQFRHGAFAKAVAEAHRVPLTREHEAHGGERIGRLIELREDAAGLYFEAIVARTQLGDDTVELLKVQALSEVSIGFRARQDARLADGTIERVKADLRELAVVKRGAYGELAAVGGVRSATDDDEPAELVEDEMSRRRAEAAARVFALLPVLSPMAS